MSEIITANKIFNNWTEKGDKETDVFSKFIYYWVAFNCWLFSKTNTMHDRVALNQIKLDEHLCSRYKIIALKNTVLVTEFKKVTPINNNRKKDKNSLIINHLNFGEVVEAIYEVRNNLFHGTKSDRKDRDILVLKSAVPVLKLLLSDVTFWDF
jgi:hypothetical protein